MGRHIAITLAAFITITIGYSQERSKFVPAAYTLGWHDEFNGPTLNESDTTDLDYLPESIGGLENVQHIE